MLLLGIDLGTSSVKISVVQADTQKAIASAQFPESEAGIISIKSGWAEQNPEQWWLYVKQAILKCHATGLYNPLEIGAIGIAYQMHGLVMVNQEGNPVRNSIIWCDSRAISYGDEAFAKMGGSAVLPELLNLPGNFTAAKLAWVKDQEPEHYIQTQKVMLPGDFIAFKFSQEITTTPSALSEGIFWDFKKNTLSEKVMQAFDFSEDLIPHILPVFSNHGSISSEIASELKLKSGISITYKSGDQPNNALSLKVMRAGEVAATAGTSGVIYGIADKPVFDPSGRINSFAHVNHTADDQKVGVLLCINGCGIMNKSIRQLTGNNHSYTAMNAEALTIQPGSEGLTILPFGNGAERMLDNQYPGAQIDGWDFNLHKLPHFFRASQEGVAFAFRYGFDIMRENGMNPDLIRAGYANMFLSDVFTRALVNVLNIPVELYDADGSVGAALGAGIGYGYFKESELGLGLNKRSTILPDSNEMYEPFYQNWLALLKKSII